MGQPCEELFAVTPEQSQNPEIRIVVVCLNYFDL